MTVSGESPVIDTSATRIQTNYDQQMLSSIPNARDMWSLLATTPSVTLNRVDVGGSTAGHADHLLRLRLLGPEPSADRRHQHHRRHGGGGLLSRLRLVRRSVHRRGRQLRRDAEPRRADAVRRQERRQPSRRSASTTTTRTSDIQGRNLDARSVPVPGEPANGRTIRPDGNRLASYKNLNLGVGGPVIKDRMWGHFAYLNQQNSVAAPPAGVIPGRHAVRHQAVQLHRQGDLPGEPGEQVHRLPAARHQGAAEPHRQQQPARRAGAHHRRFDDPAGFAELGLQGRVERHASARTCSPSSAPASSATTSASTATPKRTRYEDRSSPTRSLGGGRDWLNKRRRNQYTGALSFFKDNFAGGSHNLKVGGEYLDESGNILWDQGYADNVIHFLSSGAADRLGAPLQQRHQLAERAWRRPASFVTDTWTIDRLTLNVGARFDRYRVYLPEQSRAGWPLRPGGRDFAESSTRRRRSTTSCRASARPTT